MLINIRVEQYIERKEFSIYKEETSMMKTKEKGGKERGKL